MKFCSNPSRLFVSGLGTMVEILDASSPQLKKFTVLVIYGIYFSAISRHSCNKGGTRG